MKNVSLTVAVAAALLATGCTPGAGPSPAQTDEAPPASSAPATAPTSAPATAGRASATPTAARAATGCPGGRYTLVKFSERETGNLAATGDDLKATFADGRYTMRASGRSAYTLTNGTQEADLVLKGTLTGRYTGEGNALTYALSEADGRLTFKAAGRSRTESMKSAATTLAPQGKVSTSCTKDGMTIQLPLALLEFERR